MHWACPSVCTSSPTTIKCFPVIRRFKKSSETALPTTATTIRGPNSFISLVASDKDNDHLDFGPNSPPTGTASRAISFRISDIHWRCRSVDGTITKAGLPPWIHSLIAAIAVIVFPAPVTWSIIPTCPLDFHDCKTEIWWFIKVLEGFLFKFKLVDFLSLTCFKSSINSWRLWCSDSLCKISFGTSGKGIVFKFGSISPHSWLK